MKKLIALTLALVMVLSLTACGKTGSEAAEVPEVPDTMGGALLKEFYNQVNAGVTDTQALAEAIQANEAFEYDGIVSPVEPGYLPGFAADITGFESAATFGPMIGAIPFVGYVFALESEDQAADFEANLLENANPRWNICVEADETLSGRSGNLVFFVMCSNQEG